MKAAAIFNWIVLGYMALITLLSLFGTIAYGHGLGDLAYLFATGCMALLHLIMTLLIYRGGKQQLSLARLYFWATIFLIAALYFTYCFTLGRGGEYAWNGNIFYG